VDRAHECSAKKVFVAKGALRTCRSLLGVEAGAVRPVLTRSFVHSAIGSQDLVEHGGKGARLWLLLPIIGACG